MTADNPDACLILAIVHQDDVLQCTTTPPFQEPVWQLPSVPHVPAGSIENAATWLLSDWGFTRTPLRCLGVTSQTANQGRVQSGTLVMAAVTSRTGLRLRAPDVRGVRWRHLHDHTLDSPSPVDRLLAAITPHHPDRPRPPGLAVSG
ncbi:hypothetical protein CFP71_28105 [Amycolatopsis thailandensis]|uniref:NUDIX hydrolase n=1 Tax=Amycolatopsis thailandensis TaxID=589330 RepID=A0A229RUC9_9PSEU|nr:hypothetical protein [Amycolatopsis thailandensis]OXM50297.1 hypothetical protein CFP71_28105 [Amycolatopsis thailandensis]